MDQASTLSTEAIVALFAARSAAARNGDETTLRAVESVLRANGLIP